MSPAARTATAPRVVTAPTAEVGDVAADVVAAFIRREPTGVLGVATGGSPLDLYSALARRRAAGLDTSGLTLVALDEYVGLSAADVRSYRAYVQTLIAEPLGIPAGRVHVPSGADADDAAAYEATIDSVGGVDLQIIGIGRNGHIGFNEPGSELDSRTRVIELTESTRQANAPWFDDDPTAVPTHAMTQGIGTILDARALVLVATGAAKAPALAAALSGPVTTDLPASVIQRHPDVTVVADPDALSGAWRTAPTA
ncbi:glucosamine-6-phosphate deaminase [Nakamurella flava]|uniref:Glucosamine-6-phosphate deaminase n=1 Tax=Nakamurella flava TaxID=2576308 RepID=A0A4U6QNI5_9ACTN|nr:glucosamine-6-phosphate deaminase [Nakamurella flava]TKV62021.1 glucosamine-6-phosphate deaminase [Nakamurella flava]